MSSDIYSYLIPAIISFGVASIASTLTACKIRKQMNAMERDFEQRLSMTIASLNQLPPPSAPAYSVPQTLSYPQSQYAVPYAHYAGPSVTI